MIAVLSSAAGEELVDAGAILWNAVAVERQDLFPPRNCAAAASARLKPCNLQTLKMGQRLSLELKNGASQTPHGVDNFAQFFLTGLHAVW